MKEQTYPVLVVRCTKEEVMDNTDASFRVIVHIIKQRGRASIVFVAASRGGQTFLNARQLSQEVLHNKRVESWSNFDLSRSFASRVIAACPKNELLVLVGDDNLSCRSLRLRAFQTIEKTHRTSRRITSSNFTF